MWIKISQKNVKAEAGSTHPCTKPGTTSIKIRPLLAPTLYLLSSYRALAGVDLESITKSPNVCDQERITVRQ